jgi:hypothetical protein
MFDHGLPKDIAQKLSYTTFWPYTPEQYPEVDVSHVYYPATYGITTPPLSKKGNKFQGALQTHELGHHLNNDIKFDIPSDARMDQERKAWATTFKGMRRAGYKPDREVRDFAKNAVNSYASAYGVRRKKGSYEKTSPDLDRAKALAIRLRKQTDESLKVVANFLDYQELVSRYGWKLAPDSKPEMLAFVDGRGNVISVWGYSERLGGKHKKEVALSTWEIGVGDYPSWAIIVYRGDTLKELETALRYFENNKDHIMKSVDDYNHRRK